MILKHLRWTDWALIILCAAIVLTQVYFELRIPDIMTQMSSAETREQAIDGCIRMIISSFIAFALALSACGISAYVALSLGKTLRRKQLKNVQGMAEEELSSFTVSSLITRSTSDVNNIQQFFSMGIPIIIKAPVLTILSIYYVYIGIPKAAFLSAIMMVIFTVGAMAILHYASPYIQKSQWMVDHVNLHIKEDLDGNRMIKAHNVIPYFHDRFDAENEKLLNNNLSIIPKYSMLTPWISTVMNFLLLALYVGAIIAMSMMSNEEQIAKFSGSMAYTTYVMMMFSAVTLLMVVIRKLPRTIVSVKRVEEVIDFETYIAEGDCTEISDGPVSLEFRDVTFRYPGTSRDVVSHLSFKLEPGQKLAVVGGVGAGKSTFLRLILRLSEADTGTILVDGRDVKDYRKSVLRSCTGYVTQKPLILSGTVRDNVKYGTGSEDITDKRIMEVLEGVCAKDFIEAAGGLGAEMVQQGKNLSGGQKQRLALARAVCRNPGLYLLDSPYAALDAKTREETSRGFNALSKDSTVVLATINADLARDADLVLFLDPMDGAYSGSFEELSANCPKFCKYIEYKRKEGVM